MYKCFVGMVLLLTVSVSLACPFCATLIPVSAATHTAVANGLWSAAATWSGGVPTDGAKVVIPAGKTVTLDTATARLHWVRLDGVLTAKPDANTALNVHTIIGGTASSLRIGTVAAPVTAKHVTTFLAGPFLEGDYQKITLGYSTSGEFLVCGQSKTEWTTLAAGTEVKVGATALTLAAVPLRWAVGDRLLLAGTDSLVGETEVRYQTEEFTIAAISGNKVTLNKPAVYRHYPWRADLRIHVGNLTRNVVFRSETATPVLSRGHIMLHKGPPSTVRYAEFLNLGRTNKFAVATDPRLDVTALTLVPGSDANPRARYAMHAHKKGPGTLPDRWRGLVVDGSPGWGIVNHNSNCEVDNCIAVRCAGFGLGSEEGNERGWFRHCLAALCKGQGDTIVSTDSDHGRPEAADWGSDGSGFWLQGPTVEVSDCVSFDNSGRGFAIHNFAFNSDKTVPSYLHFAINVDGSLLPAEYNGISAITSGAVPLRQFSRNTAYGNKLGLQAWSGFGLNGAQQVGFPLGQRMRLTDTTLWGRGSKLHLEYTRQVEVNGLTVVGDGGFRPEGGISKFLQSGVLLRFEDLHVRNYSISGMPEAIGRDGTPSGTFGPGTFNKGSLVPGAALTHPQIEEIK